jgi:hypothetical protein
MQLTVLFPLHKKQEDYEVDMFLHPATRWRSGERYSLPASKTILHCPRSEPLLKVISLLTAGILTPCRFASTTARSGHTDADRIDGSLTQSSRS